MVNNTSDIVIIGGGPAGAVAGIVLVKRGYRVTIIEKQKNMKDKICGEFFSPECLSYLDEIDLRRDFLADRPANLKTLRISFDGRPVRTQLTTSAYGLSRMKFDTLLLAKAEREGVKVLRGIEVSAINRKNGHMDLSGYGRKSGHRFSCSAQYVIGATGAKSGSDSLLTLSGKQRMNSSQKIAFKFHAECPGFENRIDLYFTSCGYTGVSSIEDGLVNVCGLIDSDSIKTHNGNLKSLIIELLKNDPLLRERFAGMNNISSVITCSNLSFGMRRAIFDGILPVGDAAGSIHPFCGDGNAMALKSGLLCAGILDNGIRNNRDSEKTARHYNEMWKREFRSRITISSVVHHILANNATRSAASVVARNYPGIIHSIFKLTRESKI